MLAVRWREHQQREVVPMALLLQAFLNAHRDPQQRQQPVGFEEVMGWLGHTIRPPPAPVATPEAIAAQIEVLHAFYSQGNGQAR